MVKVEHVLWNVWLSDMYIRPRSPWNTTKNSMKPIIWSQSTILEILPQVRDIHLTKPATSCAIFPDELRMRNEHRAGGDLTATTVWRHSPGSQKVKKWNCQLLPRSLTSWWLVHQPLWTICLSNWVHLPQGVKIEKNWNHHLVNIDPANMMVGRQYFPFGFRPIFRVYVKHQGCKKFPSISRSIPPKHMQRILPKISPRTCSVRFFGGEALSSIEQWSITLPVTFH